MGFTIVSPLRGLTHAGMGWITRWAGAVIKRDTELDKEQEQEHKEQDLVYIQGEGSGMGGLGRGALVGSHTVHLLSPMHRLSPITLIASEL
jgi:hypothetical protein